MLSPPRVTPLGSMLNGEGRLMPPPTAVFRLKSLLAIEVKIAQFDVHTVLVPVESPSCGVL